MFTHPVDSELSQPYSSSWVIPQRHFDTLQNQPIRKLSYNSHHYWKMPSAATPVSNNTSNSEDSWGLWLGLIFCVVFFILIMFVLWYPADYLYSGAYHNDQNLNGIPDHKEFRAYHTHPYNYWW